MAACVPNTRQRIIFRVEIDLPSAVPALGLECGAETVSVASDRETLLFKEVADDIVRSVLLVGSLWV